MDTNQNKHKGHTGRNPNKEHSLYLVNIIVLCLITLAALGCVVFMFMRMRSDQQTIHSLNSQVSQLEAENRSKYTQEQLDQETSRSASQARQKERSDILMQIQSSLESGNTTTSMLRSLFSDDLVVVSNGRYYFFPVYSSLDKSIVKSGDFDYDDTGTLQYVGQDENISIQRGIDISARNGAIDWQAVSNDGIRFAMICAGSADEEGNINQDSALENNIKGASAQGLDIGAYFVMNAVSTQEAAAQADYAIACLADYKKSVTYPVAVIVRETEKDSRLSELSREEYTENIITFCEAVQKAGYMPMIYGNLASFLLQTDLTRLNNYEKWIADFSNNVYFPYRYSLWQYQASGQVNGIDGNVHLDLQVTQN